MRRIIVDSSSVMTIVLFIALNNCLDIKGKISFSKGFKYHLWIDRKKVYRSTLKMHNKNIFLPLESEKNGLSLRLFFCLFFYFQSKITFVLLATQKNNLAERGLFVFAFFLHIKIT
jgi:hypothetical protein